MPFPDAPRVIFDRNPLDRVICQVRFPVILKIQKDIPADFQDCVRDEFPDFNETKEVSLSIKEKEGHDLPGELIRQMLPTPTKNYEFLSADGNWKISLTRTFLALTTKNYKQRDEFQERLKGPLKALVEIYQPAYFSRIGLRYVDIIRRSILGLDGVSWTELLQPHILGFLGSSEVSEDVQALESKCEVLLDDHKSIARIAAGLVEEIETKEQCFKIDTDFFNTDRTETSEVSGKLYEFHRFASGLIQWLITKKLRNAMGPTTP